MPRAIVLFAALAALLLSARAQAKPEFLDVMTETFKGSSAKIAEKQQQYERHKHRPLD